MLKNFWNYPYCRPKIHFFRTGITLIADHFDIPLLTAPPLGIVGKLAEQSKPVKKRSQLINENGSQNL